MLNKLLTKIISYTFVYYTKWFNLLEFINNWLKLNQSKMYQTYILLILFELNKIIIYILFIYYLIILLLLVTLFTFQFKKFLKFFLTNLILYTLSYLIFFFLGIRKLTIVLVIYIIHYCLNNKIRWTDKKLLSLFDFTVPMIQKLGLKFKNLFFKLLKYLNLERNRLEAGVSKTPA